jgi:hypothetical protein
MTTTQWVNWVTRLASTILVAIAPAMTEPYKTAMQMLAAGLFGMTFPSPGQIANGKTVPPNGAKNS